MKLMNNNKLSSCCLFYKFGSGWSYYLEKHSFKEKVDPASTLNLQKLKESK